MEKDPDYNPREILRVLKKKNTKPTVYEWRVQINYPLERILAMIRNRIETERAEPTPYTVTANFITLQEALDYAYMVRLKGNLCTIYNNWTGEEYEE